MNFIYHSACEVCGKHRASGDHRACAKINQKRHANDVRVPRNKKISEKYFVGLGNAMVLREQSSE